MTCPKCKVSMSRKEFEVGYCEICGWERSRQQRLQARKSAAKRQSANNMPERVSKPQPKKEAVQVAESHQIFTNGRQLDIEDFNPKSYKASTSSAVMVLTDGRVFAGQTVLDTVYNGSHLYAPKTVLKVGRTTLYQVTESLINHMLDGNSYKRRSQRELDVQERNLELTVWLADLAGI